MNSDMASAAEVANRLSTITKRSLKWYYDAAFGSKYFTGILDV